MIPDLAVAALGLALVALILRDAFEVLVLPQRVSRAIRPARFFYRATWSVWSAVARRLPTGRRREGFLGVYGPLSLLLLFVLWAYALVLGFAMLHWGFGSQLDVGPRKANFGDDFYMSGTTFYTLGLGDVTPIGPVARILVVIEAGMGFGFLAIVVAYLPVLYQAFSRRELNISLLDARAGSPPTAEELLRRHGRDHDSLEWLLRESERWAAELMESHISYPVLAFYRSQHQNQSWLAALTTILDVSSLVHVSFEDGPARQARLTFAMARHAVVDLCQVFRAAPRPPERDRLAPDALGRMREFISGDQVALRTDAEADRKLEELRRLYEPYVNALSQRFLLTIPAWSATSPLIDNWRRSAWKDIPRSGSRTTVGVLHDDGEE